MSDLRVSAASTAAPSPPAWQVPVMVVVTVVVTVVVNVLGGLALGGSLGIALDHGYVSDPGFVEALGWTLAAGVVVALLAVNTLWQRLVTGWRPSLAVVAVVAAAGAAAFR